MESFREQRKAVCRQLKKASGTRVKQENLDPDDDAQLIGDCIQVVFDDHSRVLGHNQLSDDDDRENNERQVIYVGCCNARTRVSNVSVDEKEKENRVSNVSVDEKEKGANDLIDCKLWFDDEDGRIQLDGTT